MRATTPTYTSPVETQGGQTIEPSRTGDEPPAGPPVPGLVLVFAGGTPALQGFASAPFPDATMTLGRGTENEACVNDPRLSRRHAELRWSGASFTVRDLGSHNGTFVDGDKLEPGMRKGGRVVRAGGSVFLLSADVRPFLRGAVEVSDVQVVGPTLRAAWNEIRAVADGSTILHVHGESGSGKELAARLYHEAHGRGGPFVAVNCATIPTALAESLLFGAQRGAYTGSTASTEGYVEMADGGTLFLDEVAELALDVQAKLLRVLETREVWPLGAARARTVDLRLCTATHRDLHGDVAAGRFRQDLYFRIGRPRVDLPRLRDRLEDVPWLIAQALRRSHPSLGVGATFVEAALLRPWPGNVRELVTEVADAGRRAVARGAERLAAEHLSQTAGLPLAAPDASPSGPRTAASLSPEAIETAMRDAGGNVSAAARALGLHRTQLRRWLAKKTDVTRDDD
jgi:transcriptional regulator of acetoin/glycerol metabolism